MKGAAQLKGGVLAGNSAALPWARRGPSVMPQHSIVNGIGTLDAYLAWPWRSSRTQLTALSTRIDLFRDHLSGRELGPGAALWAASAKSAQRGRLIALLSKYGLDCHGRAGRIS